MPKKYFLNRVSIVSIAALAASLFLAAPAANAANDPVTLGGNDSYGTYTVLNGTSFELKSFVTEHALSYGALSFQVTNVGQTSTLLTAAAGYNQWSSSTGMNYQGVLAKGASISWTAFDSGHVGYDNDLALASLNTNANGIAKIQVTAFVDGDGDGIADESEEQATRTITWVDPRSTSTSTTLADTYVGAPEIDARVTFANKDINLEQTAISLGKGWDFLSIYSGAPHPVGGSVIGVSFKRNGVDERFVGWNPGLSRVVPFQPSAFPISYDEATKSLVFPWSYDIVGTQDEVGPGVYTATTYFMDAVNDYYDWRKLGETAQLVVAPDVVDHVSKISFVSPTNTVNDGQNPNSQLIRAGTTSLTLSATVYKADSERENDNPVAAGVKGTLSLSDNGLSLGSSVKVGNQTLTASGDVVEVPVTTDANGKVTVAITASGVTNDSIHAQLVVGNHSGAYTAATWRDAFYRVFSVENSLSCCGVMGNTPDFNRSMVVGGTTTVKYIVQDQFNQPAGSDYQVSVTRADYELLPTRSTEASYAYIGQVANGEASVTIKDNGQGFGSDFVIAQLQKKLPGGGVENVDSGEDQFTFVMNYVDQSMITPIAIDAYWDGGNDGVTRLEGDVVVPVNPVKLQDMTNYGPSNWMLPALLNWQYNSSYDWYTLPNTFLDTSATDPSDILAIEGTVSGAAGELAGIPVTISMPGAVFASWRTEKDTITVYTERNGWFGVGIYSDVPGKQTVTITAGGVTTTKTVTFAQSKPKTLTLVVAGGSANAQTGRTAPVSATVKDANGYPVAGVTVDFSSTGGAGSLSATSAVTDAKGVATVNYVTAIGDTGSVGFTATTADLTSLKVTVSFLHALGKVSHSKAVVTASWSNAKGQGVLVVVDGYRRYNQVELADGANSFSKKLKKGRHVVNLYLGGVLVDSLKFTVKK